MLALSAIAFETERFELVPITFPVWEVGFILSHYSPPPFCGNPDMRSVANENAKISMWYDETFDGEPWEPHLKPFARWNSHKYCFGKNRFQIRTPECSDPPMVFKYESCNDNVFVRSIANYEKG